jgi:hypothetical protein
MTMKLISQLIKEKPQKNKTDRREFPRITNENRRSPERARDFAICDQFSVKDGEIFDFSPISLVSFNPLLQDVSNENPPTTDLLREKHISYVVNHGNDKNDFVSWKTSENDFNWS